MPPSEKVDLHHCQKCRAKPHIWETPFRTCHRCKMARYCSLICQSDHYDDHKAACQAEAEERIKMNLQDDYRADELLTADSEFITFRSEAAQAVKNIEGARLEVTTVFASKDPGGDPIKKKLDLDKKANFEDVEKAVWSELKEHHTSLASDERRWDLFQRVHPFVRISEIREETEDGRSFVVRIKIKTGGT